MGITLTKDARNRLERVALLIEQEPRRINMNLWNVGTRYLDIALRPDCS